MLFSVFEKPIFDYYVRKNQNILTFSNIRIKECAKTPAPNGRARACCRTRQKYEKILKISGHYPCISLRKPLTL